MPRIGLARSKNPNYLDCSITVVILLLIIIFIIGLIILCTTLTCCRFLIGVCRRFAVQLLVLVQTSHYERRNGRLRGLMSPMVATTRIVRLATTVLGRAVALPGWFSILLIRNIGWIAVIVPVLRRLIRCRICTWQCGRGIVILFTFEYLKLIKLYFPSSSLYFHF